MERKGAIYSPGLTLSKRNALRKRLQEAADAEEQMDPPNQSGHQSHHYPLLKQNAVTTSGLGDNPRLHKSKSDPIYFFNEVKAVQETTDETSSDNERQNGLCDDGPDSSTNNVSHDNSHCFHRSISVGAVGLMSGRNQSHLTSASVSYFIPNSDDTSFGHTTRPAAVDEESISDNKDTLSSSIDSGIDHEIQRLLETSARCYDSVCHKCAEIRKYMKTLEDYTIPVKSASKEESILINMYLHSSNCSLTRCPYYWCDIFPKHLSSPEEIVCVMKERAENFAVGAFIPTSAKLVEFIKLHSDYPEYMKEDVDWTALVRLGHSRNTLLVSPTSEDQKNSTDYWVIKKVIAPVEGDGQKRLYQSLLEIKHPGVIQHLWAALFVNPEMFVVCTNFEDLSLREVVERQPIQSLDMIVNLMLKLTEILQYLHCKGILFLNWSGSNIIIDQTLTKVKLADFTASTLKEQVEDDIAQLDAYLPLHLHPPELLASAKSLDESSDVWGLGCLLHEIVTGKPVWYQFQHETLEGLRRKITKQQPVIPTSVKELTIIFKSCWEMERTKRPVLEELNQLLIDICHQRRQSTSSINYIQFPSH